MIRAVGTEREDDIEGVGYPCFSQATPGSAGGL